MIIGKNILVGTSAAFNADAQCQLLTGIYAPVLTANQRLISFHLGYADVGGSGASSIKVALYDVTSGFNGASLIAGTTQTINLDHDALTGNQWVNITGLAIDLSSLEGRRVAILLASPTSNGTGILLETVAGADRNKSVISTNPPATHSQSGTSANTFALYAVTEDFTPANVDPQLDTPQADVTIQEGQTGTIDCGANFSDANAGDTLTFSISPALASGFSFNTSTGVITYNGSQVAATAVSYTVTVDDGNGGSPASDVFSITVIAAQLTITGASTLTPDAGGTVSISLTNEAAAVTASCSAGALSGTYSAGQFILNVPNPPDFGNQSLLFESDIVVTLSDGTNTDTLTIQIQVPAAELYGAITVVDPDGVYANDAGIAAGDLAHFKNITGDPYIDPKTGLYAINPTVNTTFSYSIYDQTDGFWSANYETNSYLVEADTQAPVITLNGANPLSVPQNTTWSDPGATVTDNVDATRQISADQTVNTSVLGQVTLTYDATDAAGNAAIQVSRTVNVVAAAPDPVCSYSNTSQTAVVNNLGQSVTATLARGEIWTAAPEAGGTLVFGVDNLAITNGLFTLSSSLVNTSTTYLFIGRSTGNVPTQYIRAEVQFS